MTLRLALLACLLGAWIGLGIGVSQDVLPPSSAGSSAGDAQAAAAGRAGPIEMPDEVAIRVRPPPSGGPRFVGLLDQIDRDHKGFVTVEDLKVYYDLRVVVRRADVTPMAVR